MFYYYAHTSHKTNLDALRRGVAILKAFKEKDINCKLLVNDFRAGLVAKEQLGLDGAVNIETINDLDLILELEDSVIIDSSEQLPLQFKKLCKDFNVFRIARNCDDLPMHNEQVIYPWKLDGLFVDNAYKIETKKIDRVVFFGGDSDPKKETFENLKLLENINVELLLGHYFYVDYEQELKKNFKNVHDFEAYEELITTSSHIITTSLQCAMEARVSGGTVFFISKSPVQECTNIMLEKFNIKLINISDIKLMHNFINTTTNTEKQVTNSINFDIISIFHTINS